MMTVHGMTVSGNCYKVQLLLAQLEIPYRWVEVDVLAGGSRTPGFLAKNPNGKVPVLELDDGRTLCESNAILCFLAEGTAFLPEDRWLRAKILQWMFFEQYSHEPCLAVARFIRLFLPEDHPRRADLPGLLERGHQALAVLENHLAHHDFLAGTAWSIADIALYAYTHSAAEGGFDLSAYAGIQAWVERARRQRGFVAQGR